MLTINQSDRNTFRDSEEYRNLIDEVSELAKSVGTKFVPFSSENEQDSKRNFQRSAGEAGKR